MCPPKRQGWSLHQGEANPAHVPGSQSQLSYSFQPSREAGMPIPTVQMKEVRVSEGEVTVGPQLGSGRGWEHSS